MQSLSETILTLSPGLNFGFTAYYPLCTDRFNSISAPSVINPNLPKMPCVLAYSMHHQARISTGGTGKARPKPLLTTRR